MQTISKSILIAHLFHSQSIAWKYVYNNLMLHTKSPMHSVVTHVRSNAHDHTSCMEHWTLNSRNVNSTFAVNGWFILSTFWPSGSTLVQFSCDTFSCLYRCLVGHETLENELYGVYRFWDFERVFFALSYIVCPRYPYMWNLLTLWYVVSNIRILIGQQLRMHNHGLSTCFYFQVNLLSGEKSVASSTCPLGSTWLWWRSAAVNIRLVQLEDLCVRC